MWNISEEEEEDGDIGEGVSLDTSLLDDPPPRSEDRSPPTTLSEIKCLLEKVVNKVSENEKAIADLKEQIFR